MIRKLGKAVVAGAVVFAVAQTSDARLDFFDDFSGGGTVAAHVEGGFVTDHPSWTFTGGSTENMPTDAADGTHFETAPDSALVGRGGAGFSGNYWDGFDDSHYGAVGANRTMTVDVLNGGTMSRDRKYTLTWKNQIGMKKDMGGTTGNGGEEFPDARQSTHNSAIGWRTDVPNAAAYHMYAADVVDPDTGKGRIDFSNMLGYGSETYMITEPDGIYTHEIVIDGPNHTIQLAMYDGDGSSRTGATPLEQSVVANIVDGEGYNIESMVDVEILYDGSTWANGNRAGPRLDDMKLTSVAGDYIPEPVSLVLLGVGSLMLLRREKRA